MARHAALKSGHPLFLYLAFNAPHYTVSVPAAYRESAEFVALVDTLPEGASHLRETFAGALRLVDHEVRHLVSALEARSAASSRSSSTRCVART